jgi:hypothetical protein
MAARLYIDQESRPCLSNSGYNRIFNITPARIFSYARAHLAKYGILYLVPFHPLLSTKSLGRPMTILSTDRELVFYACDLTLHSIAPPGFALSITMACWNIILIRLYALYILVILLSTLKIIVKQTIQYWFQWWLSDSLKFVGCWDYLGYTEIF